MPLPAAPADADHTLHRVDLLHAPALSLSLSRRDSPDFTKTSQDGYTFDTYWEVRARGMWRLDVLSMLCHNHTQTRTHMKQTWRNKPARVLGTACHPVLCASLACGHSHIFSLSSRLSLPSVSDCRGGCLQRT